MRSFETYINNDESGQTDAQIKTNLWLRKCILSRPNRYVFVKTNRYVLIYMYQYYKMMLYKFISCVC